jgi:proteasome accessory factor A
MQDRVFGIETEYALIYHPARGEPLRPTNLQLYELLERALTERVRSLPRSFSLLRAKSGRFLENGASFHYEATPEQYEHGLLEMASPECRDPLTLLHHERAKDELVEELCARVTQELRRIGLGGELRAGKNNVDSRGHTFGSHESYWVEDPIPAASQLRLWLVWLPLWCLTLPVLAWIAALTPALLGLGLLALVAYVLVLLSALAVSLALKPFRPRWVDGIDRAVETGSGWIAVRIEALVASPGKLVRSLNRLVAPLFPLLELHSRLLQRFVLRRIRRDFTAFLVTRTLFCGAGAVACDGGPLLRLAQRPPFLRAVTRIFTSGPRRPLYEIRDLFLWPLSALSTRRRLHLMIGDANLCEWAQLLRVGTSALVLEAIESEDSPDWPQLADPLGALRALNRDPGLGESLELADGTRASALAIQRRYLDRAKKVLAGSRLGPVPWKERVLRDWEETVGLLETDPEALADRIDWIAKRRLLFAEIPDPDDREALQRRGATLLARRGPKGSAEERLRDLAFRALRVDLRYHELGPRGGHRRLEERGKVRRLSDPGSVAQARREPPHDTRAWGRGRAIRDACLRGRSGRATWHRVRIGLLGWYWFPDPLEGEGTHEA